MVVPGGLEADGVGVVAEGAALRGAAFGLGKREADPTFSFLYQKIAADGTHLTFGIGKNLTRRYTKRALNGGGLQVIAVVSCEQALRMERWLHSELLFGPEERQLFY